MGRAGRNFVFLYFGEFQHNPNPSNNEIIILQIKIEVLVLVKKPFLTEEIYFHMNVEDLTNIPLLLKLQKRMLNYREEKLPSDPSNFNQTCQK